MKKLFLILFILSFLCSIAFADCTVVVGQTAASGGDCTTNYYSNTGTSDGDLDIKDVASTTLVGGIFTTEGSARTLCAVTFTLTRKDADVSANTYHVEVWTRSSGSLNAQQGGDSNGVSGTVFNEWTAETPTEQKFTFASSISLSASTEYVFLITHNQAASSTTEMQLEYLTSSSGSRCTVDASNVVTVPGSGGPLMRLWE